MAWMGKRPLLAAVLEGVMLGVAAFAALIGAAWINAKGARPGLPAEYVAYCEEAGELYGICPELIESVILEESGGDPDAVGDAGEIGLMQIYPKYHMGRAESLGVNSLFDPKGNILVGADYLAELLIEHGDVATALMHYNGSVGAEGMGGGGDLTEYARSVLRRSESLERMHGK